MPPPCAPRWRSSQTPQLTATQIHNLTVPEARRPGYAERKPGSAGGSSGLGTVLLLPPRGLLGANTAACPRLPAPPPSQQSPGAVPALTCPLRLIRAVVTSGTPGCPGQAPTTVTSSHTCKASCCQATYHGSPGLEGRPGGPGPARGSSCLPQPLPLRSQRRPHPSLPLLTILLGHCPRFLVTSPLGRGTCFSSTPASTFWHRHCHPPSEGRSFPIPTPQFLDSSSAVAFVP